MIVESRQRGTPTPSGGKFRARFEYVLDDGRLIEWGPEIIDSIDDALIRMVELEPKILRRAQARDARASIKAGVTTAHKQATQQQVRQAWIKRSMRTKDLAERYKLTKPFYAILKTMSDADLVTNLSIRSKDIDKLKASWTELEAKKASIEPYLLVKN